MNQLISVAHFPCFLHVQKTRIGDVMFCIFCCVYIILPPCLLAPQSTKRHVERLRRKNFEGKTKERLKKNENENGLCKFSSKKSVFALLSDETAEGLAQLSALCVSLSGTQSGHLSDAIRDLNATRTRSFQAVDNYISFRKVSDGNSFKL